MLDKTIHKFWLVVGIWALFTLGPCPVLLTAKSTALPLIAILVFFGLPAAAWALWKEAEKEKKNKDD
jgi:phosphotransferase system  glucose/maltose/N-acetylglucosamine-specific IIC component